MSWEFTSETWETGGVVLRRIRATSDIVVDDGLITIRNGSTGGWIESYLNLSSDAWVGGDACVFGNARVFDNAWVGGYAQIDGFAHIGGQARVHGHAHVGDYAWVDDHACVEDDADVGGCAWVGDHACVVNLASVGDHAEISGCARVEDQARVGGCARIMDHAEIAACAYVKGNVWISGRVRISGDAQVASHEDFMVFKNTWSSGRTFIYTRSNRKWLVGCFYGTGDELVAKAYADSELSGRCYEAIVNAVKAIESAKNREAAKRVTQRR